MPCKQPKISVQLVLCSIWIPLLLVFSLIQFPWKCQASSFHPQLIPRFCLVTTILLWREMKVQKELLNLEQLQVFVVD
uniref:Uncharacterized protein n=1 Tax=Rhizophora mucronata TaxID=61149 RepID=A0A2P2NFC3_RHIMU